MTLQSDRLGASPPDLRQRDIVARVDGLARSDREHGLAPLTLRRSITSRPWRGLE
jgi:hypothetical protein